MGNRADAPHKNPLPCRRAGSIYDIINSLSPDGKDAFSIMRLYAGEEGGDLIYMHWRYAARYDEGIEETSFKRGMSNLLNRRIIARSPYPCKYWIDYEAIHVTPLYHHFMSRGDLTLCDMFSGDESVPDKMLRLQE